MKPLNENTSQWKWKVNPVYPDAKMVRLEILQLSKGLVRCPRSLPGTRAASAPASFHLACFTCTDCCQHLPHPLPVVLLEWLDQSVQGLLRHA